MTAKEATAQEGRFNPPWSGLLGIETDDDGSSCTLRYSRDLVGQEGGDVLHGGAITSLLDHCCGRAASLATGDWVATLDLRIDYMRPNLPDQDVVAQAEIQRVTRSAIFLKARAWQQDPERPIAAATGIFFRRPRPESFRGMDDSMFPKDIQLHFPPPSPTALDPVNHFSEAADQVLQKVPFARTLGVRAYNSGGMFFSHLPYRPELIGNPVLPALHGGAVGAFLEVSSLLHAGLMAEVKGRLIPVSITIDYLRSAQPVDTFAQVEIHRQGRSVINLTAKAWQKEPHRPVTMLHGNFMIAPEQDGA